MKLNKRIDLKISKKIIIDNYELGLVKEKGKDYYTILEYLGDEKEVVIPDLINNIEIRYISSWKSNRARKITISKNIKRILRCAFQWIDLEEIIFNEGLEYIEVNAFLGNADESLVIKEIIFPNSLLYIGYSAFMCRKIEKINFGLNLKEIGECSFFNCSLKSIDFHLESELYSIEKFAFAENDLTFFGIKKLKKIKENAFSKNNIKGLVLSPDLEYIGSEAFSYNVIDMVHGNNSNLKIVDKGCFKSNKPMELSLPHYFYGNEIIDIKKIFK